MKIIIQILLLLILFSVGASLIPTKKDCAKQNGMSIAGGLLAAPFSGGVSLGVALTAVGVGTADEIILNIQDNQSLAEYQNSAFLYNSWEVFYQTLNVVDGLVNAPGAIKSLASLVKTTMKMKFVKASSKLLKVGFYKAALGVLRGILWSTTPHKIPQQPPTKIRASTKSLLPVFLFAC